MLASMALAQEVDVTSLDQTQLDLVEAQLEGRRLPPPIGTLFANERINLHITLTTEQTAIVGVVTEKAFVSEIQKDGVAKPTLNVYLTQEVLEEIQESDNQAAAIREALDENNITYRAVGIVKKIKFSFLSLFRLFG
jgi:hypothetical protein